MLSNLIKLHYFHILLVLSCYFLFFSMSSYITTVRFHFIWWRHFSHSKEKCHGSRAHHNAKPKDYLSLVPKNNFTLEKLINHNSKDKAFNSNKSGICKIKCKDCEGCYIGQTSRIWKLGTESSK